MACEIGAVTFRVLYASLDSFKEVKGKEVPKVTDYEILSLVITVISLLIGVVSLLLKAFEYLDSRYRRK